MRSALLFALAAFLFALTPVQRAECHKAHCHGPKRCGGGWKDHRVTKISKAAGDDDKSACKAALDLLEEQTEDNALAECEKHHPCGKCPDICGSGCEQRMPKGRLGDAKKRKTTVTKSDDGKSACAVEAEVIFRCRCTMCRVKSPK